MSLSATVDRDRDRAQDRDRESSQLQQFQKLVKTWDESKSDPAHFDPTEIFCEMADILEKVIIIIIF